MNALYEKIRAHDGHTLIVASYGSENRPDEPDNVAVECEDCQEVIVDANREEEEP